MPANNGLPSGSTMSPGISESSNPDADGSGNNNTSEFTIKRRKQLSDKQGKVIRNLVKFQDEFESKFFKDNFKNIVVSDIDKFVIKSLMESLFSANFPTWRERR